MLRTTVDRDWRSHSAEGRHPCLTPSVSTTTVCNRHAVKSLALVTV